MIRIKIDGKPQNVPTKYEELSFKRMLGIIAAKDDQTKVLAAILNIDAEKLKGSILAGHIEPLIEAIRFLKEPMVIDEVPTKVGKYEIPPDLTFESVEQYECLRTEIMKASKLDDAVEQTRALALYAAIYVQGKKEPFDFEKAGYLAKELEDESCLEVMAVGSFFSSKVMSLQSGLSMNYLRKNIPLKKKKPDLRGFRRRLASMRLWIILLAMWARMTKK